MVSSKFLPKVSSLPGSGGHSQRTEPNEVVYVALVPLIVATARGPENVRAFGRPKEAYGSLDGRIPVDF